MCFELSLKSNHLLTRKEEERREEDKERVYTRRVSQFLLFFP